MVASVVLRSAMVRANGLEFGVLEAGSGPLALCLHGFPDTAHTWRHLLPALAGAGFHAVAPFMRGYAPTAVPADGAYQVGALVADAVALHEVLGGSAVGHLPGTIGFTVACRTFPSGGSVGSSTLGAVQPGMAHRRARQRDDP